MDSLSGERDPAMRIDLRKESTMRGINYVTFIARLPAKVERIPCVDPEITGQRQKKRNNIG